MAVISFTEFLGVSPLTHPTKLGKAQSQLATNTWFVNGELTPLKNPSFITNNIGSNRLGLFRYKPAPDATYWFSWDHLVDAVRSPVLNDAWARVYWTDGVKPKFTGSNLATIGGTPPYPTVGLDIGVPAPNAPTCGVTGTATDPASLAITSYYLLTMVSTYGAEGPSGPPSNQVTWRVGQTVNVYLPALPEMGNSAATTYRLYRSATGSSGSNFMFVTQLDFTAVVFHDTTLDANLGSALVTSDWTPPPANLVGLTMLPGGVLAGFVNNTLWFSEPGYPDSWPVKYQQVTDYPIVGLGVYANTLVVTTTGQPYLAQGIDPASMSLTKLDCNQACVAKRSIVDMGDSIVYASPTGLVRVSAQGATLLTAAMFTHAAWQALNPSSFVAFQWEGYYLAFFYDGTYRAITINPYNATEGVAFHTPYATAGYYDLQENQLYVADINGLSSWNTGAPLTYTWTSRAEEPGTFVNYGWLQVLADAYPVTASYYGDGALVTTVTITSKQAVRLPGQALYRRHELKLSGTGAVYAAHLAQSARDLKNV